MIIELDVPADYAETFRLECRSRGIDVRRAGENQNGNWTFVLVADTRAKVEWLALTQPE